MRRFVTAVAVAALFVAISWWWLATDRAVPFGGGASHQYASLLYHEWIAEGDPFRVISYDTYYPPAVRLLGRSHDPSAALARVRPALAVVGEPDWAPHLAPLAFADELADLRAATGSPDGFAAALPEGRLSDISHAVQSSIAAAAERNRADYGIVAEYGGHGIGTAMHMDPFLPNHGDPGHGPRLRPGMALAIEPMITAGDPETVELEDGWTVVTASGARAVHWEHSVAITDDGPRVLTLPA